jgi:Reverse transcriptase (RNA-dependent DNA polymerase)
MGSPLSPLLADIFMDNLEQKILLTNLAKKHIIFWYRYVDDILVGFNGTNRQIDSFADFMNSFHKNIKFVSEIEENNKINFLDLTISKKPDKTLEYNIYRKPTFTDTTIPSNSFTHYAHKLAAYPSFIHRAFNIPLTEKSLAEEMNIIKTIAYNNQFDINLTENIINKKQKQKTINLIYPAIKSPPNTDHTYCSLPYLGNVTEKISRKLTNT